LVEGITLELILELKVTVSLVASPKVTFPLKVEMFVTVRDPVVVTPLTLNVEVVAILVTFKSLVVTIPVKFPFLAKSSS
jgi:hypothetical protein